MTEEKNMLQGKELEKVAGSFQDYEVTEIHYDFTVGDAFEVAANLCYYVVRENAKNVNGDKMILCDRVEREMFGAKDNFVCTRQANYNVRNLVESKYVGNNIISY